MRIPGTLVLLAVVAVLVAGCEVKHTHEHHHTHGLRKPAVVVPVAVPVAPWRRPLYPVPYSPN